MLAKVRSVMSPRGQPPPNPLPEEQETIPPPKIGMVVDMSDTHLLGGLIPGRDTVVLVMSYINCFALVVTGNDKHRYPYCRPEFLYLSEDEITLCGDQSVRPIISPKYPTQMPAYAGYAEVINTGCY